MVRGFLARECYLQTWRSFEEIYNSAQHWIYGYRLSSLWAKMATLTNKYRDIFSLTFQQTLYNRVDV